MATVTISGTDFTVYSTDVEALAYHQGSISSAAAAFRDATGDTQKRAVVSATRWLDGLAWKGDKADEDQALAWPRTGTGVDGVGDDETPAAVVKACQELAALLVSDADLEATLNSAAATKRLKAGSVELEYFRPTNVTVSTPVPKTVMNLIRSLLDSVAVTYGSQSYGTSRESSLGDYGHTEGL